MIDALIKLLPYIGPAIRYADNQQRNLWRLDLLAFTLFVWVCDLAIAALYFNPQGTERTVSDTLERLYTEGSEYRRLATAINAQSPGHIKNLKG